MARLVLVLVLLHSAAGMDYQLLSDVCKDSRTCQICTNTTINCEGGGQSEHGLLTSIPINDLSPNITTLNLGFNLLRHITVGPSNETLVTHYPNLKVINLVGNHIHRFGKSFVGLNSLQDINLSMNPIRPKLKERFDLFKDLTDLRKLNISRLLFTTNKGKGTKILEVLLLALNDLKNSQIEILDFSETLGGCAVCPTYSFNISLLLQLNLTPLKEIYLANNDIDMFYSQTYYEQLCHHKTYYVTDLLIGLSQLENLEVLDITNARSRPKFYSKPYVVFQPSEFVKLRRLSNLKILKLSTSKSPHGFDPDVKIKKHSEIDMSNFKNLEVLEFKNIIFDYSTRPFYKIEPRVISLDGGCTFHNGHNLRVLDLSGPNKFMELDGIIRGLVNLEEINFNDNNCWVAPSILTCSTGNFESLKILKLRGNKVQLNAGGINSYRLFDSCTNLEFVDISYNDLNQIPSNVFQDAFRLKYLDLSFNKLTSINLELSNHGYFKFLNLSNNRLDKLDEAFTNELNKWIEHGRIDLTGNSLLCGCGNIEFVSWLQSHHKSFYQSENLTCENEIGKIVRIMELQVWALRFQCVKTIVVAVSATAGTIGVLLTIALLIYKWRFRVQYLFLLARAHFRQRNKPDAQYYFDGFFSYSSLDKRFVHDTLIRHIERDLGYKLCFDERNFLMGHVLEDLVTAAMDQSRKIIMVISQNFLESRFCTFELEMANGVLASRGSNCILLVLKEPLNTIPADLIKPRLRSLLDNRLYVEWSEEPDRQKLFWRKLQDALGQPGHIELKDEHRRNEYLVFSDQDTGICDDDGSDDEARPLLGN